MSKDNLQSRLYNFNKTVKAAIQAQKIQGHKEILVSAQLQRKGKKLNPIERASPASFSKLILNYVRHEDPDKLKVELRSRDILLWSKTFSIETESDLEIQRTSDFRGLGEAEISDLVSQKIAEIRKNDELEELRSLRDQLEGENEKLQKQIDELEESLAGKSNVEYYSNLIGLALPGLAKMLGKTSLGSSLGMLAGIQEAEPISEQSEEKNQRQAIIELVTEFMQGLDMTNLGHLYLVFIELSNNPALIPGLLSQITDKKPKP